MISRSKVTDGLNPKPWTLLSLKLGTVIDTEKVKSRYATVSICFNRNDSTTPQGS